MKVKRPRNPVARDLRDEKFRPKVIKSKKVYDRKKARRKVEPSDFSAMISCHW